MRLRDGHSLAGDVMASVASLILRNAERWQNAKLTREPEFEPVAKRLVAAKDRYQKIEATTGVPWFVIAVIHQREGAQKWTVNIANGQPFDQKTTIVPKGRGPFSSFEDAAYDALTNCAPYAAKWKDWSPGGMMTLLEQYNGLGYANKGLPSPYVWSGTDQYVKGKYVADGVFAANVVDKQLGCAGLIMAMAKLDASIQLKPSSPTLAPPPDPAPTPTTPTSQPAPSGGLFVAIVRALLALFKRN